MNFSLRGRIATSFIIVNIMVLVITFIVFHHLNSINKKIEEEVTEKSNKISLITDEIRISVVSVLRYQRKISTGKFKQELIKKFHDLCESFSTQLSSLDTLFQESEINNINAQMRSYLDSLKIVLNKSSLFNRDYRGVSEIIETKADKILDAFSQFQNYLYSQGKERNEKVKNIIKETKKKMMIILIIGFLFTLILALVIPGKIALPFKKIKDALRELQECNFDVSIYYSQNDEIGEIADEMNKMIANFKLFDELKTDRILIEKRKFNSLANLLQKLVLVANADGELIYMNNQLYSILQVQSEDVIGKNMRDSKIPSSIIESYEMAIKRRSKIENADVTIFKRATQDKVDNDIEDTNNVLKKEAEDGEVIFKGYANVIPIRGKKSSLDYYLMILSSEMFV